ncbi:flagellar basal body rod protein FlgB [Ramlibacter sp. H39-3-26]|uniref:flagellar basal body rod protein FlgB n=1 Tax=Curvibacter soli TaxID=3031331 RepID=UPI0023D9F889|nr:flagellar basal body rod protein FlgB [Ramlibacter sp. H39-3-26]MDF1485800.1 flagellar basal body rod protein FlgB [Ramlibacter sp. H39-3-26]
MIDKFTAQIDFQGKALQMRSDRQRLIASNIANADTPGYVARDFDFPSAMQQALEPQNRLGTNGATDPRHIPLPARMDGDGGTLGYTLQTQPSLDNNTVDLDRERANFVDNSVRYEAALRFINGQAKLMLSAIQGQ